MDIAPALEALDRHAAKLQTELDTVARIRKMLLETLDTDKPDLSPEAPESSPDPLAHRCPACGALPGADCVGLDWGVFHSARPGTGWKQSLQRNPAFAQPYDVACPHCLAAIGVKCADGVSGRLTGPHEARRVASETARANAQA